MWKNSFRKLKCLLQQCLLVALLKFLILKETNLPWALTFFTLVIAELYSVIFGEYNSIKPLFSVWLSHLSDPILLQYALNFHRIERNFFSHHNNGNRSVWLRRFIIWNLISLLAVVLIYQELIQPRFLASHLGSVSSMFNIG